MIFAHTHAQVMAGTKHQTLRLRYAGDHLVGRLYTASHGWRAITAVLTADDRVRWRVGGEYAVQPQRCRRAVGRIRVTSLAMVADPVTAVTADDGAFARLEGFGTAADFLAVWHTLHPREPHQPCWAIGFELVRRGRVAAAAPPAGDTGLFGAGRVGNGCRSHVDREGED